MVCCHHFQPPESAGLVAWEGDTSWETGGTSSLMTVVPINSTPRKCLIQAAAESSQTLSLELFITKSILSLASRDPGGCKPLKMAVQHGHKDCALFAADKLGSLVLLRNMCLPITSKHLLQLGQNKAACNWSQHTAAACRAMLGSKLLVDSFNHPGSLRPN